MVTRENTPAISIAFVALKAYPLFDSTVQTLVGGMETRAAIFARALAKTRRWKVNFAVMDHGQGKSRYVDDIRLVAYNPLIARIEHNVQSRFYKYKWRPVFHLDQRDVDLLWQFPFYLVTRFLPEYWRRRFWRSLQPLPQVVCCFGNNTVSAEVIAECNRSGTKAVLCVASDSDLSEHYKPNNKTPNAFNMPCWMAHYALMNADQVWVQTENQLRVLKERFGRHGRLIRNPVDISTENPSCWPSRRERDLILWIGRSDSFHKRPLLLLELAQHCPDLPFLMILNKTYADVFDAVLAQKPPNLTIIERVPHRDIWNYYQRARVFVSTSASSYEGFPNTFLQCAVTGVPVVSLTADPGEIFTRHGCGLLAHDNLDTLERHVRTLWSDMVFAEHKAHTFHNYALAHHGLDGQVKRLESLLWQVINEATAPTWRSRWRKPWHRFVSREEI